MLSKIVKRWVRLNRFYRLRKRLIRRQKACFGSTQKIGDNDQRYKFVTGLQKRMQLLRIKIARNTR